MTDGGRIAVDGGLGSFQTNFISSGSNSELVLSNFSSSSVLEPTGLGLLVGGAVLIARRRRGVSTWPSRLELPAKLELEAASLNAAIRLAPQKAPQASALQPPSLPHMSATLRPRTLTVERGES